MSQVSQSPWWVCRRMREIRMEILHILCTIDLPRESLHLLTGRTHYDRHGPCCSEVRLMLVQLDQHAQHYRPWSYTGSDNRSMCTDRIELRCLLNRLSVGFLFAYMFPYIPKLEPPPFNARKRSGFLSKLASTIVESASTTWATLGTNESMEYAYKVLTSKFLTLSHASPQWLEKCDIPPAFAS
jgi:hypothetical protein